VTTLRVQVRPFHSMAKIGFTVSLVKGSTFDRLSDNIRNEFQTKDNLPNKNSLKFIKQNHTYHYNFTFLRSIPANHQTAYLILFRCFFQAKDLESWKRAHANVHLAIHVVHIFVFCFFFVVNRRG